MLFSFQLIPIILFWLHLATSTQLNANHLRRSFSNSIRSAAVYVEDGLDFWTYECIDSQIDVRIERPVLPEYRQLDLLLLDSQPYQESEALLDGFPNFDNRTIFIWSGCLEHGDTYWLSVRDYGPDNVGSGVFKVFIDEELVTSVSDWGARYGVKFSLDATGDVTKYEQETAREIICINDESEVLVTINTDLYGSETTWSLTDKSHGVTILSGGPYDDNRFASYSYVACMNPGDYLFEIKDSAGDGLCCNNPPATSGSYTITVEDEITIEGAEFNEIETKDLHIEAQFPVEDDDPDWLGLKIGIPIAIAALLLIVILGICGLSKGNENVNDGRHPSKISEEDETEVHS